MLDKKSTKVLDAVIKAKNNIDIVNGSDVLLSYLPKKFTIDIIDRVLWYLHSQGYVECTEGDNSIYLIFLTYEGQNYKEFNQINFKNDIIKSVILPIAVSAITSLITIYLTNLFSK